MAPLSLPRLSVHDAEPLYAQIMHILEQEIRLGRLSAGDRLPTQQELADHFDVSLAPVKQALRELEERGIVSTRQGRGTFVMDATPLSEELIDANRIPCFSTETLLAGHKPASIVLLIEEIDAGSVPKAAQELEVGENIKLLHVERVRLADNKPLSLQNTYLPAAKVGGLLARGLGPDDALQRILEEEYGVGLTAGRQTISATSANQHDARQLGVRVGSPLLLVERICYTGTREPVEYVMDRRLPEFAYVVRLRRSESK
ncbi:MAG TPA: GntR family transcriptional regulator [Armatimonadota bacterium]|jgi:GntR family transcriptional regulator